MCTQHTHCEFNENEKKKDPKLYARHTYNRVHNTTFVIHAIWFIHQHVDSTHAIVPYVLHIYKWHMHIHSDTHKEARARMPRL